MKHCRKYRNLFGEALYNELSGPQQKAFKGHLNSCKECQAAFSELTSAAEIMNRRVRPEPDSTFWNGYWDRLTEKMAEDGPKASTAGSWMQRIRLRWHIDPVWTFRIAGAVGLIVIGIFVGRITYQSSRENRSGQLVMTEPVSTEFAALNQRTQNYLQRSKVLLLGLMNFDTETEDTYALDLPYQKQISQNLVREAGFLKERLSEPAQNQLRSLVADLEVILLQIANLEVENDLSTIEMVQSGVDRRAILLKINLEEMRQSEKHNPASESNHENQKRII
ncbi:zf-HC2 domain-containing protein [bacterium]